MSLIIVLPILELGVMDHDIGMLGNPYLPEIIVLQGILFDLINPSDSHAHIDLLVTSIIQGLESSQLFLLFHRLSLLFLLLENSLNDYYLIVLELLFAIESSS